MLTLHLIASYLIFLLCCALVVIVCGLEDEKKSTRTDELIVGVHLFLIWFVFFGIAVVIDYLPTR